VLTAAVQRTTSGYQTLQSTHASAAAASASSVGTMNGGCSWPADIYIKPEVEIPPEPTARSDVVVSSNGQPTEKTPTIYLGGSDARKNRDEHKTTSFDMKRDDVRSLSKTINSSEIDCREAAIEQHLTAAAGVIGGGGVYKYKDSIKRRFCSESDADAPNHVDTRSYSSMSDAASSAPESSPPSSPGAPPNSATARDDCSCCRTVPSASVDQTPGFVLHPSGAYYVPVITATAQVFNDTAPGSPLDGQQGRAVICHPVSIPVRYTGGGGSTATTASCVCVDDVASTRHGAAQCQVKSLLQLQRL